MSKDKQTQEKAQFDPVKALTDFKERWLKMDAEEKVETLLAMNMNLAYRLDILATVVSGIPDVQGMDQFAQDMPINEEAKANAQKSK